MQNKIMFRKLFFRKHIHNLFMITTHIIMKRKQKFNFPISALITHLINQQNNEHKSYSLSLVGEIFGIASSVNNIGLYAVGRGKGDKCNRTVIELYIPEQNYAILLAKILQNIDSSKENTFDHLIYDTDIMQMIYEDKGNYTEWIEFMLELVSETIGHSLKKTEKIEEQEKLLMNLCPHYKDSVLQLFIAKLLYQLLMRFPHADCSLSKVCSKIEIYLVKEYIKFLMLNFQKYQELIFRLFCLYCYLSGEAMSNDEVFWKFFCTQLPQLASPTIVEHCAICALPISLFTIEYKEDNKKIKRIGTNFFPNGLHSGKTIYCENHHSNTLLLNTLKVNTFSSSVSFCYRCGCPQESFSGVCFLCGCACKKI